MITPTNCPCPRRPQRQASDVTGIPEWQPAGDASPARTASCVPISPRASTAPPHAHREAPSMRHKILLDGDWEFLYVADDRQIEPIQVRTITVPGPWQAQFQDLRTRAGTGIYRRVFELPVGFKNGRVILHFGAVFHHTRVWLNGVPVGRHEGGFLPFAFDVSEYIVEGENEVKLRVESPTDDPTMYPEAPFAEIPFGKQSWYGPLSGMWQSVWVERRHHDTVARAKILPELATGEVA